MKLAHLFWPHESNNYKARLIQPSSLTLITLFIIVYQLLLSLAPKTGLKILGYAANIPPSEVVRLTNEKRIQAGLNPLSENAVLSQAAQAKGADMLNKDYWAHVAPDGTQPWKFFSDLGYKYKYAGENLARDFSNPSSAVEAWLASPSHKDNLLSPKYKEIGVAVIEGDLGGVDTTLVIQFFGTLYSDTTPLVPVAAAQEASKVATPKPVPSNIPTTQPQVVAKTEPNPIPKQVIISPFSSSKNISLLIVGSLLVLFMVDAILIRRKAIYRISGRSLAHISFLGMILAIVLILKAGQVL